MSTKNKANGKSKKIVAPKEPENKFPYEFLDMLSNTALNALSVHLKKTGDKHAHDLLSSVHCVILEQFNILEGGDTDNFAAEHIFETARNLAYFDDVRWFDFAGKVTPLKDRPNFLADRTEAA